MAESPQCQRKIVRHKTTKVAIYVVRLQVLQENYITLTNE